MKVVVAIDGTESAESALSYLLKAKYDNLEVHLIHVLVPGFADVSVQGIPDVMQLEKEEERSVLDKYSKLMQQSLNANVSTQIETGEVADVIASVCEKIKADEVIAPSHARHGISRIWFGSVADEIVDAAPCTVVVLKMKKNEKEMNSLLSATKPQK